MTKIRRITRLLDATCMRKKTSLLKNVEAILTLVTPV